MKNKPPKPAIVREYFEFDEVVEAMKGADAIDANYRVKRDIHEVPMGPLADVLASFIGQKTPAMKGITRWTLTIWKDKPSGD